MPDLAAALTPGGPPLLLDGGLSNQLAAQGVDLSEDGLSGEPTDRLWTARLLVDAPEHLVAAHAAYLAAGAQVLLTASYQASFEGFARRGLGRRAAARLFGDSVRLARAAGARAGRPALVAASVGPYGAVRGDGGEYRGNYGLSVAELARFHAPRVAALLDADPDLLALETVPDTVEAEALLTVVRDAGVPVWLSYTAAGGRTRAGQPLAEAFALAADEPSVVAVGVNCCRPEEVADAVALATATTGRPAVAYPNAGERWAAGGWRGPVTLRPELARAWRAAGAQLIGGCCRVGPDTIAALGAALAD
ncbi:homocysteine S-methyltransferase [Streptomyces sp. 3MP-14]|uniref:Homocysteine S-methyltransferase n=1 Tax=Streptomyces mimosae TaxID=2586635 RepID=A0A5N6AGN3_9ACTN|nr:MULTISPECIES: homocysteine S-methyltransferase [Streptomyces]KAB8167874.1 homocysteine S-methyltransferase [Streptomyces mimosae]KAB8177478.1 homocysteine S-methyltransferase [Streptomyces sp. 3MP-14]